jgi:predicted MPP superfamily phosphohydrolase
MTSKTLQIQVYSDLHIELWNKLPTLPVNSKYLFLAGDICTQNNALFYEFFTYCSKNWEKVFYTPGNHEFYSKKKNYNELSFEYKYRLDEKYKNVFYLDNEFVSLNDEFNVYGSTFWTKSPFSRLSEAKSNINDYNCISYFNKTKGYVVPLDTTYVNELSETAKNKLQAYLNETDKKTIIMTHFPPISRGTSDPKYSTSFPTTSQPYFSWPDDTIDGLNLQNVPVWISGHTHWSYNLEKNMCRFISNQLGYKSEMGKTGLEENGLFDVVFTS